MERDDQAEGVDFGSRWNDTTYARALMRADSLRALQLESILDRFGLPTRALVGPIAADAAMVIVQHNARLQPRVLAMANALPRGSVSMERLALLEDRLLVAAKQPQIYVTQLSATGAGLFRLDSLADPAHPRREEILPGCLRSRCMSVSSSNPAFASTGRRSPVSNVPIA